MEKLLIKIILIKTLDLGGFQGARHVSSTIRKFHAWFGGPPKGSVTSQILAEALQHIDSFEVFDRTNGKYPFLLLDGHQSIF